MRVICGLLLLICILILPVGCGTSTPAPKPAPGDAMSPEGIKKMLPPPPTTGAPSGTSAPKK